MSEKMPTAVRTAQVICFVMGAIYLLVGISEALTRVSFAMRFGPLLINLPLLGLLVLAFCFKPGRNAVRVAVSVCVGLHVCTRPFLKVVSSMEADGTVQSYIGVHPGISMSALVGMGVVAVVALCVNHEESTAWFKHRNA